MCVARLSGNHYSVSVPSAFEQQGAGVTLHFKLPLMFCSPASLAYSFLQLCPLVLSPVQFTEDS